MNRKTQHSNTTEVQNVSERVKETRREVEAVKAELSRIISSGISNSNAFIPEFSRKKVENQPEAQVSSSNISDNCSVPLKIPPRNPQLNKALQQPSPKKNRPYDVAEAREYIKKQRLKRNEQMKTQTRTIDNQIDLKREKLRELQKKTRELVAKNVQLKRERSKSRERVDPVRPDKTGPTTTTHQPQPSMKFIDIPKPSQLRDRSTSRDNQKSAASTRGLHLPNQKIAVSVRERSKSREKNLPNQKLAVSVRERSKSRDKNSPNQKVAVSVRERSKSREKNVTNQKSPISSTDPNLVKQPICVRDKSKSRDQNLNNLKISVQGRDRSKSCDRNLAVNRSGKQVNLQDENSGSQVSGGSRDRYVANQQAALADNSRNNRSSRWDNFESRTPIARLGNQQIDSSSRFLSQQNNTQLGIEKEDNNRNINSENVRKPQLEEVIQNWAELNGEACQLGTKQYKFKVPKPPEACLKDSKEITAHQPGTIWAHPPATLTSSYNFINTVKRKLQYALTSPGNFVDVGIQSSVPLTPQKSAQEIKNLINNGSKVDLTSFASHKNLNLDVKPIEHLGLVTKQFEKIKSINENSESDTSKNIPEISSESGVSSRQSTQTNSEPKLSLERVNNLKLQPHKLSGLIEPVKLFSKSSNDQSEKSRNSYSSDFIEDLKSSGFNTRSSSIEDTSIPDIFVALNEGFVSSSKHLEKSTTIEEIDSNIKKSIDSQNTFKSLAYTEPNSSSSYLTLQEPPISLIKNTSKSQKNSKSLDNLTKSKSSGSRYFEKNKVDEIASKSFEELTKSQSLTLHTNPQLVTEKSCGSGNDNGSKEELKTDSWGGNDSVKSTNSLRSESGYVVSKSSSSEAKSKSKLLENWGQSLVLKEPPLSLNVKKGNETNGNVMKNITLRPNTSINNNVNEIHLKFEAEVHLLNDFSESLKQFKAVEEAFEHLKRRDSDIAIAKVLQNVDTQTSIITKTSSSATVQSRNSSINYSRGSEITSDNQNNNNITPRGPLTDFTLATGWDLNNLNDTSSVMDNSNPVSFTNINDNTGAGLSLNVFEQLIRDEDARLGHLRAIVKIREQALLDRTRSELVWLTIQRNRLLETGNAEEASALKKRQRAILVKLEEERNEMKRLKQKQKDASSERKNILKQQRNLIKSQLSTSTMLSNMKLNAPKERRHSGPLRVVQSRSESIRSETSITEKRTGEEVLSVTSRSFSSRVSEEYETDLDTSVVIKPENGVARVSRHSVSNLKRTLFMREAALRKRRQEVEEQLQWHRKLVEEEKKISELEAAASSVINRKPKSTPETYQFTGKQLNQLWKNMTGRDDKHFVEDKLQVMSQGDLERFCKRARQFSGKNKKNDVIKIGLVDVSGDIAGISGSDKTSNGDYSSEFEPEFVQEIIESQEKQKISSISELIENFNRIEAEISRRSDSRSSKLSGSLEELSTAAQEVESFPLVSRSLDVTNSEILTTEELLKSSSSSVCDSSKYVPSQINITEGVSVLKEMTPNHILQISPDVEAETGGTLEIATLNTSKASTEELGPVSEELHVSSKSKYKSISSSEELGPVTEEIVISSKFKQNTKSSSEELGPVTEEMVNCLNIEHQLPIEQKSRSGSEEIGASSKSSRVSELLTEQKSEVSTEDIAASILVEEEARSSTEDIMHSLKSKCDSKSAIEESGSSLTSTLGSNSMIEQESEHISEEFVESSKPTFNSKTSIEEKSRVPTEEIVSFPKSKHELISSVDQKSRSTIDEISKSHHVSEFLIDELPESKFILGQFRDISCIEERSVTDNVTSNGCVSEEEISEKLKILEIEQLVPDNESSKTITFVLDKEKSEDLSKTTNSEEIIDLTEDSILQMSTSIQDKEESTKDSNKKPLDNDRTLDSSDKETINSAISELSKHVSLDLENVNDPSSFEETSKTGSEKTTLITKRILANEEKTTSEDALFEVATSDIVPEDTEVSGEESTTNKIYSGLTNGKSVHSKTEEESGQVLNSVNSRNEIQSSTLKEVSETEEEKNGPSSNSEPEAFSEDNKSKSSSTLKLLSKEESYANEGEEDAPLSDKTVSNALKSPAKSPGSSIETETEEETPVKKSSNQVDVKKRVSEILADANGVYRGDKSPRLQDLYVTTYDIAPTTSPEGTPEETKKVPGSIFGSEAEELLKKQLAIEQEIKQLEQQQKEQLPYVYMREIPNKPPPPYTPPSAPSVSQSICPSDPKEIDDITNYTSKVIYKAYQSNNLDNVKFSERSFKLISKLDIGKTCCQFLFNICKEIACEHYRQFEMIEEPTWLIVTKKPQLTKVRPLDGPGLEKYMNGKLKELFGFKKFEITESANIKWGRKKRDHVDEILVQESQEEESQWTNFDKDELIVKDQITNGIMTMLIDETAAIFSKILAKRKNFD